MSQHSDESPHYHISDPLTAANRPFAKKNETML